MIWTSCKWLIMSEIGDVGGATFPLKGVSLIVLGGVGST